MNLAKTIRPRISRFTLVVLGLGICVFTWGLQYKLSLYYPAHSRYHQVPEAKLLSRNEQTKKSESPSVVTGKGPSDATHLGLLLLTLTWFMGFVVPVPACGFVHERKRPWLVAARASLGAFFFRPPPISA